MLHSAEPYSSYLLDDDFLLRIWVNLDGNWNAIKITVSFKLL